MADKQQRHQKQQQQQIQHPKEVNKVKANVKSEQHQTTSSPPVDKQQKKAASPLATSICILTQQYIINLKGVYVFIGYYSMLI